MLKHTWTARGTSITHLHVALAEEYLSINTDKNKRQLL